MPHSAQRAKEALAAAVMGAVSSIAADSASILLGSPEDPGLTVDQLFDWHEDHTGVPYWNRGSITFEQYLRTAFWDQTESGGSIGYRDPGGHALWKRRSLSRCLMQRDERIRTLIITVWFLATANSLASVWEIRGATWDLASAGGLSPRVQMNTHVRARSQGA